MGERNINWTEECENSDSSKTLWIRFRSNSSHIIIDFFKNTYAIDSNIYSISITSNSNIMGYMVEHIIPNRTHRVRLLPQSSFFYFFLFKIEFFNEYWSRIKLKFKIKLYIILFPFSHLFKGYTLTRCDGLVATALDFYKKVQSSNLHRGSTFCNGIRRRI